DILRDVAVNVVDKLGYVAAVVATIETGEDLPVRALHINTDHVTDEKLDEWTALLIASLEKPYESLESIRLNLLDKDHRNNIAVQALGLKSSLTDEDLTTVFANIVDTQHYDLIDEIQDALGIVEVIAMPFYLVAEYEGTRRKERVGILLAAHNRHITDEDQNLLSAFASQAASAIESEQGRLQARILQDVITLLHVNMNNEQIILDNIVRGVVEELGFLGAIVATYEEVDDSLPVRAMYVAPSLATMEDIRNWEGLASLIKGERVSITDPNIARVYMDDPDHEVNLSWKAVKARKPVTSDSLFDLLTPFIPSNHAAKGFIKTVLRVLPIRQVIAVPFFIHHIDGDRVEPELVGNLFAATSSAEFSVRELEMLEAFGEQAAIGINNARVYQKLEQRRQIAQSLGMEAFTSAGNVHELGGHITSFQMLKIMGAIKPETPEDYKQFYDMYQQSIMPLVSRINQMHNIIESLREPWQLQPEQDAKLHACISRAIDKGIDKRRRDLYLPENYVTVNNAADHIQIPVTLATSADMLTQALSVILSNSLEAILEYDQTYGDRKKRPGKIKIAVDLKPGETNKQVRIRMEDNGIGMKKETLRQIYEPGGSSKKGHRGFGLLWTRDYIEGLGGKIQVISYWKKGTIVQIHLPAEYTMLANADSADEDDQTAPAT
ncbi:MAG: ATP-binding protein, partial [Chloroflexota bacterium]